VRCSVGPRLGGGGGGYAEGGKYAEGEKVRKKGRTRIAEVRAGANMRAAIVRKGVGQGSPVPHLSKKVRTSTRGILQPPKKCGYCAGHLQTHRSHKGADSQNHGCTVGMHSELLLQICTDRFCAESVSVAYSRDFGSARSPCHGLGGSNLLISYQRLSLPADSALAG
jgi:hypothetical protein